MITRYRLILLLVAALVAGAIVVAVVRPSAPAALEGSGVNVLSPVDQRPSAPEFTGLDGWINSPPVSVAGLHGRVILVDFWTFSCVNCVRTLPHLLTLYEAYASRGFVIVGVHSPEFDFEKSYANVVSAVHRLGVTWPVALDSEMATWNAYGNQVWPAEYLLDQQGRVAYVNLGEGNYDKTDAAVASLLGAHVSSLPSSAPQPGQATPELYAGSDRGKLADGAGYGPMGQATAYADGGLPHDRDLLQVTGAWTDYGSYLQSASPGHVRLLFHATNVFIVAGSASAQSLTVAVTLDGTAAPASSSGPALQDSHVAVSGHDLYQVLANIGSGYHAIDLAVPSGLQLYTFTFG